MITVYVSNIVTYSCSLLLNKYYNPVQPKEAREKIRSLMFLIFFTCTYSLTTGVFGARQMTSQQFSPLMSSHLFSVCLVFFSFSPYLAWVSPQLMKGRHVQTTSVCVSAPSQEVFMWPNCLRDLGKDFLVGSMFCMRCVVTCGSTSFP